MNKQKRKRISINITKFILILALVNVGSNSIVVTLNSYVLGPYSYFQKEITTFVTENVVNDPERMHIYIIMQILAFVIPVIVVMIYTMPIIFYILNPDLEELKVIKVKRRILNLPLYHSLIGAGGWVIGLGSIFVQMIFFYYKISLYEITLIPLIQFFYSIFCFVLIYYSLEFIMRRYYLHKFFPNNILSDAKASSLMSTRSRFFILFLAISVFPVLLIVAVSLGQMESWQIANAVQPVVMTILGLFIISYFISWLVAESYRKPIEDMTEAANKIRRGNFNIKILVQSHDEIGTLGETLNETASELKDKEFIKETFGKVVDPNVRDHLLRGNLNMGGELKNVTILFCDIRFFTSLSENLPPQKLVDVLNRYFEKITASITRNNGMVNKYIGDAVLGVFGAPLSLENHAQAAINAAFDMIKSLDELNEEFVRENIEPLRSGIGIHTGKVIAGNIGSSSRMEYTVIGDAVNTAARLESTTKKLNVKVLFSKSTSERLDDSVRRKNLGKISLKGKKEKVEIFTLVG